MIDHSIHCLLMARVVSKRKAQYQNVWKAVGHRGGRFKRMNSRVNLSTSSNTRHQPLDDKLQEKGFKKVRKVVDISKSDYQDMATLDFEGYCGRVFKESGFSEDRFQVDLRRQRSYLASVRNELSNTIMTCIGTGFRCTADLSLLISIPVQQPELSTAKLVNCLATSLQSLHRDSRKSDMKAIRHVYSMLVALQPRTTLAVFPGSHRNPNMRAVDSTVLPEVVELDAGDVLIFDSFLLHAGCSYIEPNRSLHVYISNGLRVNMNRNSGKLTWDGTVATIVAEKLLTVYGGIVKRTRRRKHL
jgi:hypothetical protein